MTEKKSGSKKKIWIGAGIAVLLIAGILGFRSYRKEKAMAVTYREIEVTQGEFEVTILSTGVVSPKNRLEIKPPIAGRIEKVLIQEGQTVKKGEILGWMSSTERAGLIDAARSKGAAEVKHWESLYRATPILAPIDGTIILRNVESGQTFTNVDSVFVMSDRLTVKAQVDETDIASIKLKQKAKIILDAYSKETIPAQVDAIAYDAKTVNNVTTYEVDVLPENTPSSMRSGMTANVTFIVASKQNTLTVPNDALKVQDSKYTILVKGANGAPPQEKSISVGLTDGKRTEILEGLTLGEVVLAAEIKSFGKKGEKGGSNPFAPMGNRRGGGR